MVETRYILSKLPHSVPPWKVSEDMVSITITKLPVEIIDKILRYLLSTQDLNNCSDTCKAWKEIVTYILKQKCKVFFNTYLVVQLFLPAFFFLFDLR